MFERIVSLLFLTFIVVTCMILFFGALFIWLVTVLFDRRLVLLHMYSSLWASIYVWIMPAWRVTRKGRENIHNKTYVVVSNHQSLLDILVAFSLFFPFKWVSKIEIFRVPFIGWNMVLNRYIALKRGDKESIEEMMKVSEAHLREGSSVYFFPEGTRSDTGYVKPFKLGAFTLAKKLDLPILPIVINGTTNALPKHSLNFHGHHDISIEILPEITPETFREMDEETLSNYTRDMISSHVLPPVESDS